MPLFNTNVLIKKMRKARGFSQEKLAEGICSRKTISRIEKGEHKPDWFVLQSILQKLGIRPEDFYDNVNELVSEDEAYILEKRDECQRYFDAMNQEELKNLLDKLAKDERFTKSSVRHSGRGYYVYLWFKAALHVHGPYKNTMLCLEYATEYIKLNRPDFDIDRLDEYLISSSELLALNLIAIAYWDLEQKSKAIEILFKMKNSYEKIYIVNAHTSRQYRDLLFNIAVALGNVGRHEECLEISEAGLKHALTHGDMRTCLMYLRQRGLCLSKLGNKEEGEKEYKKSLMLAYIMDGYSVVGFEDAKKEYEEVFGNKLDFLP